MMDGDGVVESQNFSKKGGASRLERFHQEVQEDRVVVELKYDIHSVS